MSGRWGAGGGAINNCISQAGGVAALFGLLAAGGATGRHEQATCALDGLCFWQHQGPGQRQGVQGHRCIGRCAGRAAGARRPCGRALAGRCGAPLRRRCAPHVCCPPVRPRPAAEARACRADRDALLMDFKPVYMLWSWPATDGRTRATRPRPGDGQRSLERRCMRSMDCGSACSTALARAPAATW